MSSEDKNKQAELKEEQLDEVAGGKTVNPANDRVDSNKNIHTKNPANERVDTNR